MGKWIKVLVLLIGVALLTMGCATFKMAFTHYDFEAPYGAMYKMPLMIPDFSEGWTGPDRAVVNDNKHCIHVWEGNAPGQGFVIVLYLHSQTPDSKLIWIIAIQRVGEDSKVKGTFADKELIELGRPSFILRSVDKLPSFEQLKNLLILLRNVTKM